MSTTINISSSRAFIIGKNMLIFEYFCSSMCDKRHLHRYVVQSGVCDTFVYHASTQADAYRPSVDSTLFPCSSDGPDICRQSMPSQAVCLSVRHTPVFCQNGYIYPQTFLPSGSQTILQFLLTKWYVNIPTGTPPLAGASNAMGYEKIGIFDQYLALSPNRYKIEPQLLRKTNRKPYLSFRMVPLVKNSQKQPKDSQNSKNNHWCTNRHMSTQSPPNTQSPRPHPPSACASASTEYTKPVITELAAR